ncbi:MAG: hypothetical protein ACTSXY_12270 [Promethearchaeota archaeon]
MATNDKKQQKKICEMSPIEICEYLQQGNHNHPVIMKHGEGYDIYYSIPIGAWGQRERKSKQNITLQEAFRIM